MRQQQTSPLCEASAARTDRARQLTLHCGVPGHSNSLSNSHIRRDKKPSTLRDAPCEISDRNPRPPETPVIARANVRNSFKIIVSTPLYLLRTSSPLVTAPSISFKQVHTYSPLAREAFQTSARYAIETGGLLRIDMLALDIAINDYHLTYLARLRSLVLCFRLI